MMACMRFHRALLQAKVPVRGAALLMMKHACRLSTTGSCCGLSSPAITAPTSCTY
jgi:hypothetical protein